MRGVSGTGKSTRARQLVGQGQIFSTDDFFGTGETYTKNYNTDKLGTAHRWNMDRVRQAMEQGISPIVVDNTNLMPYEAKPYVLMANQHGYEIRIEEPQTDHWNRVKTQRSPEEIAALAKELASRNLHGAPPETIAQMISQYSPYSSADALQSIAPWEPKPK